MFDIRVTPGGPLTTSGFSTKDEHDVTRSVCHDRDMSEQTTAAPERRPPLVRESDQASGLGGVSRALAGWIGVEPTTVRLAFAVSSLFNGIGLVLYGLLWALLPDREGRAPAHRLGLRLDLQQRDPVLLGGFTMVVTGFLMFVRQTGLWFPSSYIWPLVALAVGLAVVWGPQRATRSPIALGRWVIGGSMVLIGFGSLFGSGRSFAAARQMALDAAVVLAGIALLFGPFVTRLIRRLRIEEQARATSEAKADVAAHLHDSVLQTLALIQKRADQPTQVVTIARRQERELREWLYGTPKHYETSLTARLEQIASDLEGDYGIPIDVVTVGGDVRLDSVEAERLDGLLAAAREAMSNATRHSGAAKISVYVEVQPEECEPEGRERVDRRPHAAARWIRTGPVVKERRNRCGADAPASSGESR
jgi:signal transduction histidine kinase